jgi:hypothetical protein
MRLPPAAQSEVQARFRPIAYRPADHIRRWGPQKVVDRLRLYARCERRGHRGASLSMSSWQDNIAGFAPWPERFS